MGRTTVKLSDDEELSEEVGDSGRDAGKGICEGEMGGDGLSSGRATSDGVGGRGGETAGDGDNEDEVEDSGDDNGVAGGGLFPRLRVVKGTGTEGMRRDGSLTPR